MLYDTLLLVFGLLVAILILAGIATRIRVPYAVLLLLEGALLSAIPGLPSFRLDPDLVLLLFLPPLIYSSAWFTSWRDFRTNLRALTNWRKKTGYQGSTPLACAPFTQKSSVALLPMLLYQWRT